MDEVLVESFLSWSFVAYRPNPSQLSALTINKIPYIIQQEEWRRIVHVGHLFTLPSFQDPEVQKHATQILRKMLEQEEAELQV